VYKIVENIRLINTANPYTFNILVALICEKFISGINLSNFLSIFYSFKNYKAKERVNEYKKIRYNVTAVFAFEVIGIISPYPTDTVVTKLK
jgi:hypothetical protein